MNREKWKGVIVDIIDTWQGTVYKNEKAFDTKSKEKYSELNQKEHHYKYKKYVGFSKDGENVILTVEKRKYNEDRNFWINEFKDKL